MSSADTPTPDDLIANLRGVAGFYRSSTNMGTKVARVMCAEGEFAIEAVDLDTVADELVRLRAENEKLRATLDGTTQFCPRCVEKDAEIVRLVAVLDEHVPNWRTYR